MTATGACTVGVVNAGSGGCEAKAASTAAVGSCISRWARGSAVCTCVNLNSLGSRQKSGAHWAVAWFISSEP